MNRILVIRPGAIGDALLAFPVLKALREQYAGMPITLVSNAQVLPLALAFGVAEQTFDFQDIYWSELFSTAGLRTSSMLALLKQTDLAICWMRDPDSIVERNLNMSGVKHVLIAPGRPSDGARIHIVDYLASTVGLPAVGARYIAPLFLPTPDPISNETTGRPVAIHPGSGAVRKCWPASCFAAVIERLRQQNRSVLLLSGPADTGRVHHLLQYLPSLPGPEMLTLLANAPLLEVARQLQSCRCYLGNDSGITHLAAMLGVHTIAIFGPTDPAIWRPVGPSVTVLQGHTMEDVTVDSVMGAII
jgi:glycosyl transferase family 9 (putative heptosyltransferase)